MTPHRPSSGPVILAQRSRREAVRQRLYELHALVGSLLTQESEVCLPLLAASEPSGR